MLLTQLRIFTLYHYHLDSRDDVEPLDDVHELPPIISLLEEGLVEEDHAGDALKLGLGDGEQELPGSGDSVKWAVSNLVLLVIQICQLHP